MFSTFRSLFSKPQEKAPPPLVLPPLPADKLVMPRPKAAVRFSKPAMAGTPKAMARKLALHKAQAKARQKRLMALPTG